MYNGDYDGDTFRSIGIFMDESNREAAELIEKPMNYIDMSGNLMRHVSRESGVSLYMFSLDE